MADTDMLMSCPSQEDSVALQLGAGGRGSSVVAALNLKWTLFQVIMGRERREFKCHRFFLFLSSFSKFSLILFFFIYCMSLGSFPETLNRWFCFVLFFLK